MKTNDLKVGDIINITLVEEARVTDIDLDVVYTTRGSIPHDDTTRTIELVKRPVDPDKLKFNDIVRWSVGDYVSDPVIVEAARGDLVFTSGDCISVNDVTAWSAVPFRLQKVDPTVLTAGDIIHHGGITFTVVHRGTNHLVGKYMSQEITFGLDGDWYMVIFDG